MDYNEIAQEIFSSGGDISSISPQQKNEWYQVVIQMKADKESNLSAFTNSVQSFVFSSEPNEFKKIAYKLAQLEGIEAFSDKYFLR